MSVVVVGSYYRPDSLHSHVVDVLTAECGATGSEVERVILSDLDLNLLALGGQQPRGAGREGEAARRIADAVHRCQRAKLMCVVTPVYNAGYSGATKLFLDAIPAGTLDATVLPVGTVGTELHGLALAYSLVPVLQALGAPHVLRPVSVSPHDWHTTADGSRRLGPETVSRLRRRLGPPPVPPETGAPEFRQEVLPA
ncbi:NADPH-dependent FMN reductase [Streptomyces sp. NPDC021093]|uniref:NADPH-dependent FMN reductase n=1 Tax=Streptomyces sp. NPDC021093 TaxID=3365112 RepID=UPI0037AC12CB